MGQLVHLNQYVSKKVSNLLRTLDDLTYEHPDVFTSKSPHLLSDIRLRFKIAANGGIASLRKEITNLESDIFSGKYGLSEEYTKLMKNFIIKLKKFTGITETRAEKYEPGMTRL